MIKKKFIFFSILLFIVSFYVNFLAANIGILPIDSFAFFDTGYLTSKGLHPLKDFWVSTGILVDYIQAIFFKLFGVSWFTYVLHASFINYLLTILSFIFFYKNGLNIYLSFFYSLFISVLFYPNIGTPFAYHHALMFSVLSLLILYSIIEFNKKFLWFCLPISMVLSFLCMQAPSGYVNLLIIFYLIYHLINKKDYVNYKYFLSGSLACIISLIFYFLFFEIPIYNFIYQYILFPISIGGDRLIGNNGAFITLNSKMTFKSIFLDFKFIYFTLLIFIYVFFKNYKLLTSNILKKNLEILIIVIFFSLILIFNQMITANQIYIFCIIPILGGITHLHIAKFDNKNKLIKILLIFIVIVSGVKYFERFVIERKFIDLENINFQNSFIANKLSPKFSNLRWKSVHFPSNPNLEFENLKLVIKEIKNDSRRIMIISHYQFFSGILDKNLNNLNRWYTHDNNSYPLDRHKYFNVYKDFINSKIKKNKIQVIYIVDATGKGWLKISNFEQYLNDICFSNKIIVKDYFSSHTIKNCE